MLDVLSDAEAMAFDLGRVRALRAYADSIRTTEALYAGPNGEPVRANDLARASAAHIEEEAKRRYGGAWDAMVARAGSPAAEDSTLDTPAPGLSRVPPLSDAERVARTRDYWTTGAGSEPPSTARPPLMKVMPDTTAPADRDEPTKPPRCGRPYDHAAHYLGDAEQWVCDGAPAPGTRGPAVHADETDWRIGVWVDGKWVPGTTADAIREWKLLGDRTAVVITSTGETLSTFLRCGFANDPDHRPHEMTVTGQWPPHGPHGWCEGGPA